MAKAKSTKAKYVSAGLVPTVNKKLLNALRREYMQSAERLINQQIAFYKGKRVVFTVPNPDKNNTKERFIKVPAQYVKPKHAAVQG